MHGRSHDPDEALLRDVPHDPEAFTAFYRRHVREVLGFLVRRTRDPEQAADLTAEVFAAVLLQTKRYRSDRGSAQAWLLSIAAHKQGDARRRGHAEARAQRRLGLRDVLVTEDDIQEITGYGEDVEATLEVLPGDQRDAVRGRVIEELGYDELADRSGVSQAAMRQRVARGSPRCAREGRPHEALHGGAARGALRRQRSGAATAGGGTDTGSPRRGARPGRRRQLRRRPDRWPGRTDSATGADEAAIRCQAALQRRAESTSRRHPRPTAGELREPLRAVVAAFAKAASGADDDAAAQCAGASIDAATFYTKGVRYVGPGPFGGRTYLVAVPPDALPGPRAPDGGACVVTIGAPTAFDPTSGCDTLSDIATQQAFRSAEVPGAGTVPGELATLGTPPELTRGSFLTAVIAAPPGPSSVRLVYRRYPSVTAEVRRIVVSVHVPRSAPNAFPRFVDLLDETGRLVRRSTLEAGAG